LNSAPGDTGQALHFNIEITLFLYLLNTALMVATTGKAHMHNPAAQKKPKLPQMRSLRNGQLTGMQDQHGKE
jgi:hypothetical protein